VQVFDHHRRLDLGNYETGDCGGAVQQHGQIRYGGRRSGRVHPQEQAFQAVSPVNPLSGGAARFFLAFRRDSIFKINNDRFGGAAEGLGETVGAVAWNEQQAFWSKHDGRAFLRIPGRTCITCFLLFAPGSGACTEQKPRNQRDVSATALLDALVNGLIAFL
jgi:hypothetical protein